MTLENCKRLLEKAEASENAEDIAFWKARIERKGGEIEAPKEVKSGKKSKG